MRLFLVIFKHCGAAACQFQCKLQNILCHKADDSYDKKIKAENIRALKGILQFLHNHITNFLAQTNRK